MLKFLYYFNNGREAALFPLLENSAIAGKRRTKRDGGKVTERQLDCLCSPVRAELYEAIRRLESGSAAELAVELGKSVHALYYHLRALHKVGLIRVRERRRVGRRDEAVYEAASDRLVIDKDNSNRAYVEGLIKTIRIALRRAEREHREARLNQAAGELFAVLRVQARLSEEDAAQLRKKIWDLGTWIRKRQLPEGADGAEEVAVTCLAVPLNQVDE